MSRRFNILSLTLLLPLLLAAWLLQVSQAASQEGDWPQKLDAALAERLESGDPEPLRFIVHLQQQPALPPTLPENKVERRALLVEALQQTAASSQRSLQSALATYQSQGQVTLIRPLWIINAIIVEGQAAVIPLIAERADVAQVTLDSRQQFLQPPSLQPQTAPPSDWNITQIRAPQVWNGLGVTGEGVTIAIMDTGVDWAHPDLQQSYRGWRSGGAAQHEGNWFDALAGNSLGEPSDPNGHGTHVAGTALGRGGTGVAPGANWIAVRAFDSGGFATTGDLHLAFQWLLAPGGRPELAPDIVNGSWSGPGQVPVFERDIGLLHQAGIMTVFAAGNNGPETGTIGAPASYEGTLAVAAVDYRREVAWFSSRGPSPLTAAPKPDVAAPGARVYSTLPGASYGYYNGTSMAAPHVSGVAALLLSANPGLDLDSLKRAITQTARRAPGANHDVHQGWGQLDAYAAVAGQMNVGQIRGSVVAAGQPVPGAELIVTASEGLTLRFKADGEGVYHAWLRPGVYQLRAAQFGFTAAPPLTIQVQPDGVAFQNVILNRLPHRSVHGIVSDAESGEPLPDVRVLVDQTPLSATTDANGAYSLQLPAATGFTARAQKNGFRLAEAAIAPGGSGALQLNFVLTATQTILLVDSGRWYYDSHATAYHEALRAAAFAFDEWNIYTPDETPPAELLQQYDTVIWTAPQDAPGWLGGGDALLSFLDNGGNLLVSGQNVARRDGINPTAHRWFTDYLQGRYYGLATAPYTITSAGGGPYMGLQFALNAPGSAANQVSPSQIVPAGGSLAQALLRYQGDDEVAAALQAGRCSPFRIHFLAFGLEGVASLETRQALLQRSLDAFAAPPAQRALALSPMQTNEVMLPGETLTVTYSLQNLSELLTTTIRLDYRSQWPSHLSHDSVTLGPCQQQPITFTLRAPDPLPHDARQAIELNASADYGAVAGASIVAKAPARVLVVADYRWYDETAAYRAALSQRQIPFDTWDTNERGSPSLQRLSAYEAVVWYTGYDWYDPLSASEIDNLQAYLDQGGRLFLSSQDYLYYHRHRAFTGSYLGVLDYQESLTSTVLLGSDNALLGDAFGPLPLAFGAYRNFSDGLAPLPAAGVHLWNDWGSVAGTINAGDAWRSIFWSVPFELLPAAQRAPVLGSIMGRLGDLGDSTLELSPRIAPQTATRHYTLTARNWHAQQAHMATLTTTLHPDLEPVASSLPAGLSYDRERRQLSWQGLLAPQGEHIVTFQARAAGHAPSGSRLEVTSTISYEGMLAPWQSTVATWVNAPDLSASDLSAAPNSVQPYQRLRYTAYLHNSATVPAQHVTATLTLPFGVVPITSSIESSTGSATLLGHRLQWVGEVSTGAPLSFSIAVSTTGVSQQRTLPAGLVVNDGLSAPLVRNESITVAPYRWLLPLIHR